PPLIDHVSLVVVAHRDATLAVHHIPHAHVQPICGTVEYHARRIVAIHLYAAHQLGGLRVHDLYRAILISLPRNDANIIQPLYEIVGRVIRIPMRGALSTGQFDGLRHLEGGPAVSYGVAIYTVQPRFIGGRVKEGLTRISAEGRFVDHLARFHIHDHQLLIVLAGIKHDLV